MEALMKEEWVHAELIPTSNGGYVVRYRKHTGNRFSLPKVGGPASRSSWIGINLPQALLLCTALIVTTSIGTALLSHGQEVGIVYPSISAPSLRNLISKHQMLAQRSFTEGQARFEKVNFIAQEIRKLRRAQTHDPSELALMIVKESEALNYDPLLVAAVVKAESTFNPAARSPGRTTGTLQPRPGSASRTNEAVRLCGENSPE